MMGNFGEKIRNFLSLSSRENKEEQESNTDSGIIEAPNPESGDDTGNGKDSTMAIPQKQKLGPAGDPSKRKPLVGVASVLSVASLGWTTWSLMDLLGVGPVGLTVALTADLIWSAVIYCEYRKIGGAWVKTLGWLAVLVVGGFIVYHGLTLDNPAMAAAGPFLTVGTKAVWELALMSLRDPVKDKKAEARQEIDLLSAEAEIIRERAQAQIAKERAEAAAEHERKVSAKKQTHELEMMDSRHEAEKLKLNAENDSAVLYSTLKAMNIEEIHKLFRVQTQTIAGEIMPPQDEPPKGRRRKQQELPAPPDSRKTPEFPEEAKDVYVDVEGLNTAKAELKRLAAVWYMMEAKAKEQGDLLSKAEFARRVGVNKAQVTRATNEFSLKSINKPEFGQGEAESA